MTLHNRIAGAVKLAAGAGGLVSAVCFGALGYWWLIPAGVAGVMWMLVGAVQVVTGAGEDY